MEKQEPSWLLSARLELGQSELPGDDHNVRILAYHLETTLRATTDEVPWCSSFVCAMMEWNDIPSTRSAAARSWLQWGKTLMTPREGCIVVFQRGSSPWMGHVGFYVGETKDTIKVLGGNQGNAVSVAEYSKDKLLGYRWPLEEWIDG